MPGPFEAFGVVLGLFILFFIAIFVFGVVAVVVTLQKRGRTKEDYQSALNRYRANPADLGLRQAALEAGRAYSRFTRNQYGNAYFDEAGIRNDLDSIAEAAPPIAEPPKTSIEGRLQMLQGLWSQGLISEIEYQNRRSAILDEV